MSSWMRSGERRGTIVLLVIAALIVAMMALSRMAGEAVSSNEEMSNTCDVEIDTTSVHSVQTPSKAKRTSVGKKKNVKAKQSGKSESAPTSRDYLRERID